MKNSEEQELRLMATEVMRAKATMEFEVINDRLARIQVWDTSTIVLVGWLRTTSSIKQHLPAWANLHALATVVINRRSANAAHLLRGLIK